MEQNKFCHVVLVSFRPETSEVVRQKVYGIYQTLAENCGGKKAGINFWKVDWNLDLRKNVHLVEIAIFENNEAFQKFQANPKHKELADIVKEVADWQVGDISLANQFFAPRF